MNLVTSKKSLLTLAATLLFFTTAMGQSFIPRTLNFSTKKESKVILTDGTVIKGFFKGVKFSKGLIKEVKFQENGGSKRKISAADISKMHLVPSAMGKLAAFNESTTSIKTMMKADFDAVLKKDSVYFEQALLPGKKPKYVLMQHINPGFDSKIRVYDDPMAKKTMGVAPAGVAITGGVLKSYYVVKNNKAYKIEKKHYKKEQFDLLFGDEAEMKQKYEKIDWDDLPAHVFAYDQIGKEVEEEKKEEKKDEVEQ